MAGTFMRDVRRAVLIHLKADANVTALIPASAIQPPGGEPAWPIFLRWGTPDGRAVGFGCTAGSDMSGALHVFAKPEYDESGGMTMTAQDRAENAVAALETSLIWKTLSLESGKQVRILHEMSRLLADPDEADAYHGIFEFAGEVRGV